MKKKLAIKGHESRGKEVIEILEMLGASNKKDYTGSYPTTLYILNDNNIDLAYTCDCEDQEIFKLEDFLRKYPFKIGDKVINDNYSGYGIIITMVWDSVDWCVKYCVNFCDVGIITWVKCDEIKISDICLIDGKIDGKYSLLGCITSANLSGNTVRVGKISRAKIDSEICEDEVELILDNYEIVTRGDKTFAIKKKPKYPTTYEECCSVLGMTFDYPDIRMVSNDEYNLYSSFIQLIRCRDAYWKIADNWKPDWTKNTEKYVIYHYQYLYSIDVENYRNTILAFPTKEMRDVFYENFKDLIEKCKELL